MCPVMHKPVLGGWEWSIFSFEHLSMYLCHISLLQRYIIDILIFGVGSEALLFEYVETMGLIYQAFTP